MMNIQDNAAFQNMWEAIPEEAREWCDIASSGGVIPEFVDTRGFAFTTFTGIGFYSFEKDALSIRFAGDTDNCVGYLYANSCGGFQWVWNPAFKEKIEKAKVE